MCEREVEMAIGFSDGTWVSRAIRVPEPLYAVFDEEDIRISALEIAEQLDFEDQEVVFRTIIQISEPEGGYGDDSY